MKIKQKVRIIYRRLIPTKVRCRISRIRCILFPGSSREVSRKCSNDYLSALSAVSKPFLKQESRNFQTLRPLHKVFSDNKVRSRLLGNDWWANFIFAANYSDEKGQQAQGKLLSDLKSLPPEKLNYWEYLHLYSLALRVGLFVVGYELRLKAREAAIVFLKKKKGKMPKEEIIRAIAAQLEAGQYTQARGNIAMLGEDVSCKKQFLSYLCDLIDPERGMGFMPDDEDDKKFRDYVSGKKIAVVSPAKTVQQDAVEIDSYDRVVRCNYKEQGAGIDSKAKGLRCDISYIAESPAKSLFGQEAVNFPREIKWIICRSKRTADKFINFFDSFRFDGDSCIRTIRTRSINESSNRVFFQGWLNAVPHIATDLLRFNPSSIFIFHADLMLSIERDSQYSLRVWRIEDYKMKEVFLRLSSYCHDPVVQYWILHALWMRKKIKGDERFEEVMSMGEREYMRQLQCVYGSAGRLRGNEK